MTSKIKVDNINKVSDDSTIIKKCGSTTTVGSGAGNTVVVCGSTVTIGRCGGSVALASGASQTGFGREGSVNWQTGSIKTSTFTAASGEGYFINSGSAITANLPAGSAGAIVAFSDYARNFNTHNFTISPNGSEKIGGVNADLILDVNGQAITLVYVDSTKGWVNVQNAEDTETGQVQFISATGGTISCTPTCKIHTFTGPGTFCVSAVSTVDTNRNKVAYMVVAGGGGGSSDIGGGGGAGGFREGRNNPITPYTASPLAASCSALTVTASAFPITVGAGGVGKTPAPVAGTRGGDSIFSSITSAGGGTNEGSLQPGGSGSGKGHRGGCGGCGNTPSVSPPQGQNGGAAPNPAGYAGSGGGGASGTGGSTSGGYPSTGGPGGAGVTTEITNSPVAYAGGGGGGGFLSGGTASGGTGGGGTGGTGSPGSTAATSGTANTGGGGGGGAYSPPGAAPLDGGAGGSGIVVIRYKKA
jgi:hypothetical protein